MTDPRPQKYELHIADTRSMSCDLCDCGINKGNYYVIELPSYYRLCRRCIKTLYVFLQDNESIIRTM